MDAHEIFMRTLKSNRTSEVFKPLFQETEEVHKYRMRQSAQQKYHIKRSKLQIGKKTIGDIGRSIWNSIPLGTR